jgi:2-phospho-L-lactate transferase/gluconeogenesis factor (CofD/UPF0052 family)
MGRVLIMNNERKVTAVREFTENGLVWFPQVWVEPLQSWHEINSVRFRRPEGFKCPREAIKEGQTHIGVTA